MKAAIALALAASTLGAASSAQPGPQRYNLEPQVRGGDSAEARPRLIIAAGEPATIQIANQKYALRMTASPDAAGNVAIASLVTSWTSNGLAHQDKQAEVRADGSLVQLRFPRIDGALSTGEIVVDVRVSPAAN